MRLAAIILAILLVCTATFYGKTDASKLASNEMANFILKLPPSNITETVQMAMIDGLFDVAEKWLLEADSSGKFITEPEKTRKIFLLAQIKCLQGKFQEALPLLNGINTNKIATESYDLEIWKSIAMAETGDRSQAIKMLQDFRTNVKNREKSAIALQIEAEMLKAESRYQEAAQCYELLDKEYKDCISVRANQLKWAKCLKTINDLDKAIKLLKKILSENDIDSTALMAKIELCKIYYEQENWNELKNIAMSGLNDRRVPEQTKLPLIITLINAEEKQHSIAKAIDLLSSYENKITQTELKKILGVKKGELLIKNGKPEEGIRLIRSYLVFNQDENVNAEIILNVAALLFSEGLFEKSAREFQNYIEAFSDSNGLYKAYSGKADALMKLNRFQEAASAYEKASLYSSSPVDKIALLLKAADVLVEDEKYESAIRLYYRAIECVPESDEAKEAIIQIARCYLKTGEKEKALELLWELFDSSSDKNIIVKTLIALSDVYYKSNQKDIALLLNKWALNSAKNTSMLPEAYYAFGNTLYNSYAFKEALEAFSFVYSQITNSPLAPEAMYMAGWSSYMLGDDNKTKELFEKVIKNYPASFVAQKALYKNAELLFNEQKYEEAEKAFALFSEKYPATPQIEDALYWAGRAALKRGEYRQSLAYLSKMATLFPNGAYIAAARFTQGEALIGLGDFSGAIVMFQEVIKAEQSIELIKKSLIRIGDSHFILGRNDPTRFNEALINYKKAFEMDTKDATLQVELFYKIGRTFEKMGKAQEALEAYLQSMYAFQQYSHYDNIAQVWFVRAAFAAAELKEAENNWRKAVEFYEKVANEDLPAAEDAKKRIEQIKTEHWLFFY